MDQDTKKMTRTAIYVAAGGYLLYLAYQLFGRLSESTGLSYTVSMAAMVLFAAGVAGLGLVSAPLVRFFTDVANGLY